MFSKTDPVEQSYETFKDRLTLMDFKTKVDALGKKKWDFVRANFLCQQALRCKDCEPNVAMVLLCSCAEAMKVAGAKGSHNKFKKFYLNYCPSSLRVPPIKYYLDGKPSTYNNASFDEALDYIYAKFRCFYVHKGVARLELPPKDVHLIGNELIDKLQKNSNKSYVIDVLNILGWFSTITKESLYKIL